MLAYYVSVQHHPSIHPSADVLVYTSCVFAGRKGFPEWALFEIHLSR
jgi:hypothetical protein